MKLVLDLIGERGSRKYLHFWIPAYAGMTTYGLWTRRIEIPCKGRSTRMERVMSKGRLKCMSCRACCSHHRGRNEIVRAGGC